MVSPAIKFNSHILLELDIVETQFSPAIVSHPFTSCAIDFTGRNLLTDEAALKEWKSTIGGMIDMANSVFDIYVLVNKPYKLLFVKVMFPHLTMEEKAELLTDAWKNSENPNMDANVSISEVVHMFKQSGKANLMDNKERAYYDALPDPVTVYRGVSVGRNPKGISWTDDYETAKWFAHRFDSKGKHGYIQKAVVAKKDILAYYECENEIVVRVDPKKVVKVA